MPKKFIRKYLVTKSPDPPSGDHSQKAHSILTTSMEIGSSSLLGGSGDLVSRY